MATSIIRQFSFFVYQRKIRSSYLYDLATVDIISQNNYISSFLMEPWHMCSYYFCSFKFMPPTNLQMYSLSNFYYGIVYICVVQGSCTLSYVVCFLLFLHPFYTLGYQYFYQPVLNVVCNACSHSSCIRASVNTFRSSIRFFSFSTHFDISQNSPTSVPSIFSSLLFLIF